MANYALSNSGSYWYSNKGSTGWDNAAIRQGRYSSSSELHYSGIINVSAANRSNIISTYADNYPTSASLTVTRYGIGDHGSPRTGKFGVGTGVYGSTAPSFHAYQNTTVNAGTGSTTVISIPTSWIDYFCTTNKSCFTLGDGTVSPAHLGITTSGTLTINWATRNTAPYWGSGAAVSVSGTINGGYVQAGTTMTISWPAAQDAQSNVTRYYYSVSTNGGSSYGSETNNGTTRSFTYSNSTQGAQLRFRIRAYDSGGLYSGYLTSGTTTVNYSPSTPTISTIGGAAPGTDNNIPYNAQMVVNIPTHNGGFASGWSYLHYRQSGTYSTSWSTSRTINLTGLHNHVGSTCSISAQVSDGWVTTTSTAYTKKIGATLAAPSLTLSKSTLDSTTTVTINSCLIDGQYYSAATEALTLQYNINSTGWKTLWTGNRTYSSRTAANNTKVSNLLQRLFDASSSFVSADATIQLRASATTGHLSSGQGGVASLTYTSAKFTSYSITQADGSTTFKYPMNNQIPVTEQSFRASCVSTKSVNFSDTVTVRLFYKIGSGGVWNTIESKSQTGTSLASNFDVLFSSISLNRGTTIYLKIELTSTANGRTITHAVVEPGWDNGGTTKQIEYRAFPSFSASVVGPQSSFVRNGITDNGVAATIRLTTDMNKAYYIGSAIGFSAIEKLEEIYITLFDNLNSTHDYSAQFKIANTLTSNAFDRISFKILADDLSGIAATPRIPNNGNQTLYYAFTVYEAYRNSTEASTPIPYGDGSIVSGRDYTNIQVTQATNTFCKPVFNPTPDITFTRI